MGGWLETGQHQQRGGFTRTGWPKHGEELTFWNVEIEVFYNQDLTIIAFLNFVEADKRFGPVVYRLLFGQTQTGAPI